MTQQEFRNGVWFTPTDNNWRIQVFYYSKGLILNLDHDSPKTYAWVLAIDSKYVYVRFFLLGQEVKKKIPFNSLTKLI